jgi:hypothetical protein
MLARAIADDRSVILHPELRRPTKLFDASFLLDFELR